MNALASTVLRAAMLAAVALIVPACAQDHDGQDPPGAATMAAPPALPPGPVTAVHEVEPNDTPADANKILPGLPGEGGQELGGLDEDLWRLYLPMEAVVRVQLFAHRFTQALWHVAGNSAVLEVWDGEGMAMIQRAFGGAGDPEIPALFLPSGEHLIRVSKADPAAAGGRYVLLASILEGAQVEWESKFGASNDTPMSAQPLTSSTGLLAGTRVALNDDYYVVPINGPSMLRLECRAQQMSEDFDPLLEIADSAGHTLALFDDGMGRDAVGSYAFVEPGKYFVRCGAALVEQGGRYVLAWSVSPVTLAGPAGGAVGIAYGDVAHGTLVDQADVDRYMFLGAPGDQVLVEVCAGPTLAGAADPVVVDIVRADDEASIALSTFTGTGAVNVHTVRAILQKWGQYCVRVRPDAAPAPTPYMFRLSVIRTGPREPAIDAFPIPFPKIGVIAGAVDPAGDEDAYLFKAAAGEFMVFRLIGGNPASIVSAPYGGYGSAIQGRVTILASATKELLAASDRVLLPPPQGGLVPDASVELAFVAPHDGLFLVCVAETTGAGGPEHFYLLDRD